MILDVSKPPTQNQRLKNLVLDFLYKHVKRGRSNKFIMNLLKHKKMPPMTNQELNGLREWFKKLEHDRPEKMAEFRRKLLGC